MYTEYLTESKKIKLEDVVLNKCIQFFEELFSAKEDNELYGDLPGYLIIEYNDAIRITDRDSKLCF